MGEIRERYVIVASGVLFLGSCGQVHSVWNMHRQAVQ